MKEQKGRKAMRRMKVRPIPEIDRNEMDRNIFDVVLKYLYINADKNVLDLDNDVLSHMTIKLPVREKERVWDVLTGSGWVSPKIGFGNAGKIGLTKAGFQLMSQFGSYTDYLAAVHDKPVQQVATNTPLVPGEGNQPAQQQPPQPGTAAIGPIA